MKYKSHIVYVLNIDDGSAFYVGSHNGAREYSETAILSQSGNILQKQACLTHNWDEYYSRVKLEKVEQFNTQEDALKREQELITSMFEVLKPEQILNKSKRCNMHSSKYSYEHDAKWKEHYAEVMRKPKQTSTSRMGRRKNEEI